MTCMTNNGSFPLTSYNIIPAISITININLFIPQRFHVHFVLAFEIDAMLGKSIVSTV